MKKMLYKWDAIAQNWLKMILKIIQKLVLSIFLIYPIFGLASVAQLQQSIAKHNPDYRKQALIRESNDDRKNYGDATAHYLWAYDGDTFTADVKDNNQIEIKDYPNRDDQRSRIRLALIDAPEIKGNCQDEKQLAIKARDFVRSKLKNAHKIELKNMRHDHFGRILANVYVDGKNLSQQLIDQNLAIYFSGSNQFDWC